MTVRVKLSRARERQLREQGWTDGRTGRRPRWSTFEVYRDAYRKGEESRKRVDG